MLKLINVCKSFKYGREKSLILDNINLDFKKKELVFILGKSGSGKSTLLNIIGGILEIDSGSIMLDGQDITKFSKRKLCSYRNNMIGFIFQDYHLVEYMSVIDNIKLGMTIKNKNNDKIFDILKKLGIYDKRKIKVNKLSGGEKQRVAIARALINNPDIILCDEPTGALDSNNGIKIMDILKDIANNKLVIVVSHDNALANKYADRIINIVDGKVDYVQMDDNDKFRRIQNSKINLLHIIKLAIKNLCLKKGRTLFTSFAISVGFISMLLVLCLSKSFNDDIIKLEKNIVSAFPVSIYNGEYEIEDDNTISSDDKIIIEKKENGVYTNKINQHFLDYLNNINEISYIGYKYDISMPIISDKYKILDNDYIRMLPSDNYINNNYEFLYGNNIKNMNDILLKVDSNNNVDSDLLEVFDIDTDISYEELVGRKFKIILNDLFYKEVGKYYFINNDNKKLYNDSEIELNVVGIVKEKEIVNDISYFYYNRNLVEYIININSNSRIVLEQLKRSDNVLGINISKDELLSYLGYNTLPNGIDIYVSNLSNKKVLLNKLDEYNKKYDKLIYVDTMNEAISILKSVINIITVILVCFSLIAILVSSMMIFILTNNRVVERIKEIGILRSLGARTKDISRLFNIENFIIGIISSMIGIIVVKVLSNPINYLMELYLEDGELFKIDGILIIISIVFNMFVVLLSGYIPTKMAGKKKIIDCINNRM